MDLLGIIVLAGLALWLFFGIGYLIGDSLKRHDVVDSFWGPGFIIVAWTAVWLNNNLSGLKIFAGTLVTIWGLRLFIRITRRNLKREEDFRYQDMLRKWGYSKLQAYFKIYFLQALLVLLISTPLLAIITRDKPFNSPLVYIGFAIWAFGIVFEAVADYQLDRYLKNRQSRQVLDTGLWRYSRHPNYFGEIVLWWGAGLVALSAEQWWGLLGPITITFLIMKVSGVPLLEKHFETSEAYREYKKHTSVLIPLPRR